jgi:hypothetical protein
VKLEEILPQKEIRGLSESDWRHRMFLDTEPQVLEMRGCVMRLLDFAERQGVLNIEMLARLRSEDYDQFRSAIHELAVAEFLSPIGEINWHPQGRDSRIGEFEIIPINHELIFVEVKTIFDTPETRRQYKNLQTIRGIVHRVLSPFRIDIEFINLQCDIVPRHFRAWFKQQILTLRENVKAIGQEVESFFEDGCENNKVVKIKVEFSRDREYDLPTTCNLFFGLMKVELHERVKEVVDGALGQLPDTKPTLVVVVPAITFGIDEFQMLTAMFSFPKVTYNTGIAPIEQEPTVHFDLQGIVQQSIRTRLSAVGVWHHEWTKAPQGSLDIYHNPLRAKEISHGILELPNVCQLIPKGEGTMEWMPNRPSQ